jgi:hypothetical protein
MARCFAPPFLNYQFLEVTEVPEVSNVCRRYVTLVVSKCLRWDWNGLSVRHTITIDQSDFRFSWRPFFSIIDPPDLKAVLRKHFRLSNAGRENSVNSIQTSRSNETAWMQFER